VDAARSSIFLERTETGLFFFLICRNFTFFIFDFLGTSKSEFSFVDRGFEAASNAIKEDPPTNTESICFLDSDSKS
jgi:hypothetical protein